MIYYVVCISVIVVYHVYDMYLGGMSCMRREQRPVLHRVIIATLCLMHRRRPRHLLPCHSQVTIMTLM